MFKDLPKININDDDIANIIKSSFPINTVPVQELILALEFIELKLTTRQYETILLYVRYSTRMEISDFLCCSMTALKSRVGAILKKTKFKTMTELVEYYNELLRLLILREDNIFLNKKEKIEGTNLRPGMLINIGPDVT